MIIKSIQDIKKVLQKQNIKAFGVGGTPITRTEVHSFTPDFEAICSVQSGELDSVQHRITSTCFPLTNSGGGAIKKPGVILANPSVRAHINKRSTDKKVGILVMKPTKELHSVCKENNWALLGNHPDDVERYNDKNEFQKILKEIQFPSRAISLPLNQLPKKLDSLFNSLGDHIVIQLPKSGGGRGTFFFKRTQQHEIPQLIDKRINTLNEEVAKDEMIVVNAFYKGSSLSTLGCITKDNGILTLLPQYQLIDIPNVTKNKSDGTGIFCGHDWTLSNDIPEKICTESATITKNIGTALQKKGLLGIFGVDLMWDKARDTVIPIEVNARITGTFPTIIHVQLANNEIPLIAFHMLDFLDIPYKITPTYQQNKKQKRHGAHLILFNPYTHPIIVTEDMHGGVYSLRKEKLHFERHGFELSDIKHDHEFIITDGVPVRGMCYGKNRKICKIITKNSICEKNNPEKLNPWAAHIVSAIYTKLHVKKTA